jgi:hypothetical protein
MESKLRTKYKNIFPFLSFKYLKIVENRFMC